MSVRTAEIVVIVHVTANIFDQCMFLRMMRRDAARLLKPGPLYMPRKQNSCGIETEFRKTNYHSSFYHVVHVFANIFNQNTFCE